jgi:hypothetical protein
VSTSATTTSPPDLLLLQMMTCSTNCCWDEKRLANLKLQQQVQSNIVLVGPALLCVYSWQALDAICTPCRTSTLKPKPSANLRMHTCCCTFKP